MRKILIFVMILMILCYGAGLVRDLESLHEGIIRLHVVGASDAEADQNVKLLVRDAVNAYLETELADVQTVEEANEVIRNDLPELKAVAEQVLREQGFSDTIQVSLEREAFPLREYDTFTLPSGVYRSLRIRIGEAEGRNWWCVVFPSLCLSAAGEDLRDTAAGAGFSDSLTNTLTGEEEYEIRFFLLDWLGQVQNLWFEQ